MPVPPRGYWAKKLAHKPVVKISLPAFVEKPLKEKNIKQNAPKQEDLNLKQTTNRRTKAPNIFGDREQEIKKKLKEFRRSQSAGTHYAVTIKSWHFDYSFGLNQNYNPLRQYEELSFLHECPYSEHRILSFKGDILEPIHLKDQKMEISLFRERYLNESSIKENLRHYEQDPPKAIGSFWKTGYATMASVSVPEDAFALLLQNAAANKINFATLYGEKMKYGRGRIFRFYLQETYEEEESD